MTKWFRVYDDLVDDPKVQLLPAELFKFLLNLWCLTSQNGGVLPPLEHIAFKLRLSPSRVSKMMAELRKSGLLDDDDEGTRPHNWNRRQFKADVTDPTNAERQKRYRNKQRNAEGNAEGNEDGNGNSNAKTVTPTVMPKRPESESESDSEKKNISIASQSQGGRGADRPAVDAAFDQFWQEYPKRDGANPKAPALKKFGAVLKSGADPRSLIDGARRYRAECDAKNLTGTPMVAQAITWLNQQRWSDYAPQGPPSDAPPGERPGRPPGMPLTAWNKYGEHWTPETPVNLRPDQWETWKKGHVNGQAGAPEITPLDGSGVGLVHGKQQLF